MAEDDGSQKYGGSGEEEESLEGSIRSMTDGSTSIVGGSDSDRSCVSTRHGTLAAGESPRDTHPSHKAACTPRQRSADNKHAIHSI